MNTIIFNELRKNGDLFAVSLDGMRTLIHQVCMLTKVNESCPYLREHGKFDSITCETCPFRKEQQND